MLEIKPILDLQLDEHHAVFRQRFEEVMSKSPMRNIEVAKTIGITEGQLISAYQLISIPKQDFTIATLERFLRQGTASMVSIGLKKEWSEILQFVKNFKEVMALTRNEACIHEKLGTYENYMKQGDIGLFLGEIDLRLFFKEWHAGFMILENKGGMMVKSIQFFNKEGVAIHKIFMRKTSDLSMLDEFLELFTQRSRSESHRNQAKKSFDAKSILTEFSSPTLQQSKSSSEIPEIEIKAFRAAWSGLRDAHEFIDLLKKFNISRLQAFKLIGEDFASPVDNESTHDIFRAAMNERIPVMIFVGNGAVIQIHTGVIHNVSSMGSWLNILDGGFNLHLRESLIHSTWVVRKPTKDGVITSLEIFDRQGEVIAMVFGERQPGVSERCDWRRMIESQVQEMRV